MTKFEARVTEQFKEELSLASTLEGTSLTEYVVRHLEPCIKRTLRRARMLELTAEASERFAAALLEDEARILPYLREAQTEYETRALGEGE